jgi:hypothetical protein
MPKTDVETLVVQMSADLKAFERAFARARGTSIRELRSIERQAQQSTTRIESILSRFGKGLVAGLGIGSIAEIGRTIQQAISQAAKIGDLSDKIGLGTDSLQALQLSAAQADLSFDDLDKTLLRFSKTLGEAANGQGEYLKTLRANGQELKGTFLENLKQLADLVANAKNEQEALLIITQAMGKGSDEWLEVLKKGSDGIRQLGEEARAAGAIVENSLIKEAQRLDDEWAALMTKMGTYTQTFAVKAAKTLGGIFANAQKISESLQRRDLRGFFFGHEGGLSGAIGDALFGPDQSLAPEDPLMRPPRGSNAPVRTGPVTKVSNPEEEAEKRRKLAERLREEKRAREELTREIERQFEAFTRSLTSIDEDIAATRLEAETLGLATGEIERQRVAQELLNDANRAGIAVTTGINEVIQQKAQAAGDAAQALEDLQKQQEALEERQEAFRDSAKGFLTDLRSGVEPVDALTSALGRLADRLFELALDETFNSLFKPGTTGGSSGAGDIFKALGFAKGGIMTGRGPVPLRSYASGGIATRPQLALFGEGSRPEAFVPLPDGKRIPVSLDLPMPRPGAAGGGYGNVTVNNYGAQVVTRERPRPDGRRDLELEVRRIVTEEVADPYSNSSVALGARGARNPVKRR